MRKAAGFFGATFSSYRNAKTSRRRRRKLTPQTSHIESLEDRSLLSALTVTSQQALTPVKASTTSGEKPQAKTWEYNGTWFAVIPNSSGTYVWRLDGTSWTQLTQISTRTDTHADIKVVDDKVYVLLVSTNTSETPVATQANLRVLQYVSTGGGTYQPWSAQPNLVSIPGIAGTETATIDVDSTGRMWIAYTQGSSTRTLYVRYCDSPYTTWSNPIQLASGLNSDDICSVTAMPGHIGVFWSNQNTKRFGFRLHTDGADPNTWGADEVPASQSALKLGTGMSDDHLHLAVSSNGTLYAAVKTSYDTSGYPKLALLIRRPNGTWDNLYAIGTASEGVLSKGTRPFIVLNDATSTLLYAWSNTESSGPIYYREITDTGSGIVLGAIQTLITGSGSVSTSSLNNVSGPKANVTDSVVFVAGGSGYFSGEKLTLSADTTPRAVNDSYTVADGGTLSTTSTNGVLVNDVNPLGHSLSAQLVSSTIHGTLTFNSDGTFTYVNDGSANATDTFTYRVLDGQTQGSIGTVTINVTQPSPPNQPPQTQSVTATFQNGLNGYAGATDTFLDSTSKTTSDGSATTLTVDGDTPKGAILRWDVSSIPAGAIIDSANIVLNVTNSSTDVFPIYGLLKNFDSATANWNQAAANSPWQTAGAAGAQDRSATALFNSALSKTGSQTIALNSSGVALVQQWINNPGANFGLIFQAYSSSKPDRLDFSSSEATTIGQRPQLTIAYHVNAQLAAGAVPADPYVAPDGILTEDNLNPIISEADAEILAAAPQWERARIAAALHRVQFDITQLPGRYLGTTAGNVVRLDADGAGLGWFIDGTPSDSSEFPSRVAGHQRNAVSGPAVGRYDLLTVVEHELGHVLGNPDVSTPNELMSESLPTGARRFIDSDTFFSNFSDHTD